MPYVFSMTTRMATIAACCVLLLCVLLFLLGVEIGARYVAPAQASGTPAASERAPVPASADAPTAASAAPASNAS